MASPIPPCTHELRPGTTVCLRCQHAERGIKRAKQRQMLARGGAAVVSLVVIAAIGIAGATAFRARGRSAPVTTISTEPSDSTLGADSVESDSTAVVPVADPNPGSVAVLQAAPPARTPAAAVPAVTHPVAPPVVTAKQVALVVPVGRSELRDTMIAERAGDTVRVNFDLLLSRTRRADKFESIMRSTLPQVYGPGVDSALRALPVGSVALAGDLMTTLPERGFHIRLTDGRTLGVWPVTRAGRDGPLVVAYRAVASR